VVLVLVDMEHMEEVSGMKGWVQTTEWVFAPSEVVQ